MMSKPKTKIKYYTTEAIDATHARIRITFGRRTNGKTTAILLKGYNKRINSMNGRKEQMIYIRRWEQEIKPSNDIDTLFDGVKSIVNIEEDTGGLYNTIIYKARKFYFAKMEDEKIIDIDVKPFCICLALSQNEHYKSLNFPDVTTVCFDEFLSENHQYLPNEYTRLKSIISTITRLRDDVEIHLIGNSVDRNCIYWNEFRIVEIIKKMKDGDLYHYKPKNHKTDIAIEWAESNIAPGTEAINVYTDFDDGKADMINSGEWDVDDYPHLPFSYNQNDILFIFFIEFNTEIFQCEIINKFNTPYIYIHRKTTEFKDIDNDLIYGNNPTGKPNYSINLYKPEYKIQHKICDLFHYNKVFYQDNLVGDAVHAFLEWCKHNA